MYTFFQSQIFESVEITQREEDKNKRQEKSPFSQASMIKSRYRITKPQYKT